MGMTIDNIIKELLINKEDDTYVLGNETIDFAVDTMRKYQKIEEILHNGFGKGVYAVFDEIVKVVEYEKRKSMT